MNLELSRDEIYNILRRKTYLMEINQLKTQIKRVYLRTLSLLDPLLSGVISGFERNDDLGNTNPLIWEFGHVVYFWEHKTIRLLFKDFNKNPLLKKCLLRDSEKLYNSHIVCREERFENKYNLQVILSTYQNIIEYLINFLDNSPKEYNPISCYLILISLLHNEMHNESFLFSSQLLDLKNPFTLSNYKSNNNDPINIKMIPIIGHKFSQGTDRDTYNFTFDNEMPASFIEVKDFKVSKYPITQYQYMKFVESDGYHNKTYWCQQGWRWIKKK